MLGRFGEVLVIDWGVARILDAPPADEGSSGPPGIMPPEQASGRCCDVDVRADVFALGAMLEAMLAAPLPRPLRGDRTKARRPARSTDRYQTVEALARDIARYREGEPVEAYRENVFERGWLASTTIPRANPAGGGVHDDARDSAAVAARI